MWGRAFNEYLKVNFLVVYIIPNRNRTLVDNTYFLLDSVKPYPTLIQQGLLALILVEQINKYKQISTVTADILH